MFESEHLEIRNRFGTKILELMPLPIWWPNAPFTPPNPKSSWLRLHIESGTPIQTTFGATLNNYRNRGRITVSIFTAPEVGSDLGIQIADVVGSIFFNWSGSDLTCRAPEMKIVGLDKDGWYQINVTIPYHRNTLK